MEDSEKARDKNRDEYNEAADAYEKFSNENILMQKYCYYSTFNELEKEGIEGKTFLEIGCGPCPIGQKLVAKGAKKVYGLDISQQMIDDAKVSLGEKGILDKFELICADIFDTNFELPEKCDGVVLSYVLTTFLNNYDMLQAILKQCHKFTKGYLMIADFCYVKMAKEDLNFYGMHTATDDGQPPKDFATFDFLVSEAPNHKFKIFHISPELMFKAGREAGFNNITYQNQYPDPDFAQNEVVRKYIDTCNPTDYILKFRVDKI